MTEEKKPPKPPPDEDQPRPPVKEPPTEEPPVEEPPPRNRRNEKTSGLSGKAEGEPYGSEAGSDTVIPKNYVWRKERANVFLLVD